MTDNCPICRRAERALRAYGPLAAIAKLVVRRLGDPGVRAPANVVGGPTLVFQGKVVGLGTPDCPALVRRLLAMLADQVPLQEAE